jgi:hypothetical protein
MAKEAIATLSSLVWNIHDDGNSTAIEGQVLQSFLDEGMELPRWNVAF